MATLIRMLRARRRGTGRTLVLELSIDPDEVIAQLTHRGGS